LRATVEYAAIPVVIFTGMTLDPDEEQTARQHNAQVFYKPQRYSVLIEYLGKALGRAPAA
jgi:hypothetical protein